jgi:hypothetical protein
VPFAVHHGDACTLRLANGTIHCNRNEIAFPFRRVEDNGKRREMDRLFLTSVALERRNWSLESLGDSRLHQPKTATDVASPDQPAFSDVSSRDEAMGYDP